MKKVVCNHEETRRYAWRGSNCARPWTVSTEQKRNKPAANCVTHQAPNARMTCVAPSEAKPHGRRRPVNTFKADTVMLSAVATAATLAKSKVRARTGKGERISKSRRSGN